MTVIDTLTTVVAQVAANTPVSWETAVFGFAAMAAGMAAKKMGEVEKLGRGIERKVDTISVLLHGVPEQQGRGGIVHDIEHLKTRLETVERGGRDANAH